MSLNSSIWIEERGRETIYPKLQNKLQSDFLIVGGGITGITLAYLLAKAGKKVILLEKGEIGSGDTAYTTAFLTYPADQDLQKLKKKFGDKKAAMVWNSLRLAIKKINEIVEEENIDCDFTFCPLYMYPAEESHLRFLKKEYDLSKKYGFPVSWIKRDQGVWPTELMCIEENARFHPLKYIDALAKHAEEYGARIFEHSEVKKFKGKNPIQVYTSEGSVLAREIILATHTPNNAAADIHLRLESQQTYVISGTFPKGEIQEGLYIDTNDPYFYLRVESEANKARFLLGGCDHETGRPPKQNPFEQLEQYLRDIAPHVHYKITHRWSGEIHESIDGLPYIGKSLIARKQWIATGFAGDGMTFGTLSAVLLFNELLKLPNPYAKLYSPLRLHSPIGLLKRIWANLRGFLKERLDFKNEMVSIPCQSGKVVHYQGKNLAIYRDKNGKYHRMSAVCTHLKCIVAWNEFEKTWDCPCHGSRFTKLGKVKSGPAKTNLKMFR